MDINELKEATDLLKQRENIEFLLVQTSYMEVQQNGWFRFFHHTPFFIDREMEEALQNAVRNELNRRKIAINGKLVSLGVNLETAGDVA